MTQDNPERSPLASNERLGGAIAVKAYEGKALAQALIARLEAKGVLTSEDAQEVQIDADERVRAFMVRNGIEIPDLIQPESPSSATPGQEVYERK